MHNSRNSEPVRSVLMRRIGALWCVGLAALGLAGCKAVRPTEQRLVAKPNMTFSESAAFAYNPSRLYPQLATGAATTAGPQNSGCTSCR